jgi:HK97 family phage major capsid protein
MTDTQTAVELKRINDQAVASVAKLAGQVADLQAEMRRPAPPLQKGSGFAGYQTPGTRLIEMKDAVDMAKVSGRVRIDMGTFFPSFEQKTLIDSAALGFSTPGVLESERVSPIAPLAKRRLTVADLIRHKPVQSGQISWIQESAFTNAASPQAESSDKGESANTFGVGYDKVATIAHWVPVSRQALDDLPELGRFLDQNLIYGLRLKLETELLAGDGLGDHLSGLLTQAGSYAGTYAVAGDTRVDKLNWAILELEDGDDQPNGLILNPVDYRRIVAVKTEEGGANKGRYVIGDPLGGYITVPTLWGLPVVRTNSIAVGSYLVGDFNQAVVADRQAATIDVSESHSDYFTKNKLAIRAEMRVGFAVLRASAFLKGTF